MLEIQEKQSIMELPNNPATSHPLAQTKRAETLKRNGEEKINTLSSNDLVVVAKHIIEIIGFSTKPSRSRKRKASWVNYQPFYQRTSISLLLIISSSFVIKLTTPSWRHVETIIRSCSPFILLSKKCFHPSFVKSTILKIGLW